MSTDRPAGGPGREDREGEERRATDDDRRLADENAAAGSSTRSMPVERQPGYAGREPIAAGRPRTDNPVGVGRLRVGFNWGAAFFGWVAAMGLAVLLTAFIAAVGAAVGITRGTTTVTDATNQLQQQNAQTVGLVGIILLAVVAFVSYYCGGYVAARMSRFEGAKQGLAVWLWAVVVAVVVAIVAAVAGAKFDVLSTLNTFPRLPVNQGDLTGAGIVALLVLLLITLAGAVLGGLAGMRYHRRLENAESELAE